MDFKQAIQRPTILLLIVAIYVAIRIYMATPSSFGFYHGWNEAWYSSIARNYFSSSLWYQIPTTGAEPFFSVPPLFSYLVFGAFNIFGISDLSARIVSIFAEVLAIAAVYILSKELYNEKIAYISVLFFIFMPWNILWFGRAQTDPLMTALMTLAIALFVYAYNHEKSMIPFGIAFGLAVFTKQPALAIIPIIFIWVYFKGIKKHLLKKSFFSAIIGLIPLFIWLAYHIVSGNSSFVDHLLYGELAHRSVPFSDFMKVSVATFVGVSPLLLLSTLYAIWTMEKRIKNLLIIWLVLYGIFVLVRTPPSHEYYSLPLMPVFAILAAKGAVLFGERKKLNSTVIIGIIILSTIPVSYIMLSYTGDLGYNCTKEVGEYLKDHINPDESYLILTPSRYVPQMIWYANLTNKQVYGINNDLSSVSVADIEYLANKSKVTRAFLVIDSRGGLVERMNVKYKKVYVSRYETKLLNLASVYTGEKSDVKHFGQELTVFKLI